MFKAKRGSKLASNSEETQPSIVYAICKICGISEPKEDLVDETCEHCISGKSQITVAEIARPKDKETSNKQNRKQLSFMVFWVGAGVSIYLGIYIFSEYGSLWGLSLILTVAPILILYPIVGSFFSFLVCTQELVFLRQRWLLKRS